MKASEVVVGGGLSAFVRRRDIGEVISHNRGGAQYSHQVPCYPPPSGALILLGRSPPLSRY